MSLQKKDFIEIEFSAKIKEGGIFDSNIKEELAKAGIQGETKPLVFCLGEGMFLKGVEDFLIGKKIGEYAIELSPENAFGKRNPKLITMVPLKEFKAQNINPIPGSIFNMDGRLAKVLTVSSGRVMLDFNNPLAGKEVIYEIHVLKKVEDLNEKTKSLIEFFFRQDFEFKIEDKKLTLNATKEFKQFAELFKDKFKEILDLDLIVEEIENKESNNSK